MFCLEVYFYLRSWRIGYIDLHNSTILLYHKTYYIPREVMGAYSGQGILYHMVLLPKRPVYPDLENLQRGQHHVGTRFTTVDPALKSNHSFSHSTSNLNWIDLADHLSSNLRSSKMSITHIVLFQFKPGTDSQAIKDVCFQMEYAFLTGNSCPAY